MNNEAPDAEIVLRTREGKEANPRHTFQMFDLDASRSGVVEVEAAGPDAEKALKIIREIAKRDDISHEEVDEYRFGNTSEGIAPL